MFIYKNIVGSLRLCTKRKCLISTHSQSMVEWQHMHCRLKRQKVTIITHTDGVNVTQIAKPPQDEDSQGSVCKDEEEEETLVRSNQQSCVSVKPSNSLACEACMFWANNARLVTSACHLHLNLDLTNLLEARLTGKDTDEEAALAIMKQRDYNDHPKIRILK